MIRVRLPDHLDGVRKIHIMKENVGKERNSNLPKVAGSLFEADTSSIEGFWPADRADRPFDFTQRRLFGGSLARI
jgi:hypothetical protein